MVSARVAPVSDRKWPVVQELRTRMMLMAYDLAGKAMGDQFEGNTP